MHQYRITKYDPALRNESGACMAADWTSFSDIGKPFNGTVLTEPEYRRVEDACITTILNFLTEDNAPEVHAVGVEQSDGSVEVPKQGVSIPHDNLAMVCRSLLREEFWCRLHTTGRFVHFGYDYYLYIGVQSPCPNTIAAARSLGLFVEPFVSPYHEDDVG